MISLKTVDVKKLRVKAKLTQMELAAACEVSINTIVKWENRIGSIKEENYQKLLKATKTSPPSG